MKDSKEKIILEAALKIFEKKGFNASTTSEIAKEAGVAEGTIFRYFKTKKDIFKTLEVKLIEMMGPLVIEKPLKAIESSGDRDIKEVFKEILVERVKFMTDKLPIVKIVLSEALIHEEIKNSLVDKIVLKVKPKVEVLFKKNMEEGKIRNVDSDALLRTFVFAFISIVTFQFVFDKKYTDEEIESAVENSLDILLYGIIPR